MEKELEKTIDLIRKAQNGDKKSLDLLFERYYDRVKRIVKLRLTEGIRNKVETFDIVQEVFYKVLKSFKDFSQFKTESSFLHWLSKIVENTIKDEIDYFTAEKRNFKKEFPLEYPQNDAENIQYQTFPGNDPTPSKVLEHEEEMKLIESAILNLSNLEKEVIIMHYYEGLSFKEISEKLNKTYDAIRMMHNRALAKMVKFFEEKTK